MTDNNSVKLSFEDQTQRIAFADLVLLKSLRSGVKESKKYAQILSSVRAIGLVEAPVVAPNPAQEGQFFLLDGHLRIEALKDLGASEVECIISTDDESYTYNKRINRLAAIQEHRMVRRAIERGVPEAKIAEALGLEIASIHRRSRMLNGICAEAIEILKDAPCPIAVFDILRRMSSIRQIEAAELMTGQNNFTVVFAKAMLAATPEGQLVTVPAKRPASVSSEQIARMERELAGLQMQVKSVEDRFGADTLHLTVARAYVRTLLGNERIVRWISQHRPDISTNSRRSARSRRSHLCPKQRNSGDDGDPDPISAGTAGDAARWGGSRAGRGWRRSRTEPARLAAIGQPIFMGARSWGMRAPRERVEMFSIGEIASIQMCSIRRVP